MFGCRFPLLILLVTTILTSCGSTPQQVSSTPTPTATRVPLADLQPVKWGNPLTYCHVSNPKKGYIALIVKIQNQGYVAAPPSMTKIIYTPVTAGVEEFSYS